MTDITSIPRRRPPQIDMRSLETEVKDATRAMTVPEQHHEVPDLGRLAADAVLATVEHAAHEVEKLGNMVKELAPKLEEAMLEMDNSLKTISEAAKVLRDKGERTRLLVEATNTLAKEIGQKCAEFTKMVNG